MSRFHPLGYNVKEMYPGQHPAESVLDYIMTIVRDPGWNDHCKCDQVEAVVIGYFEHKATLPKTPDYDPALAGPALNELRKIAHELVVGLVARDKLGNGWPLPLDETCRLVEQLDAQMQYLWPEIEDADRSQVREVKYVVTYTKNHGPGLVSDHYLRCDTIDEAISQYDRLRQEDGTYSVDVSRIITSTD